MLLFAAAAACAVGIHQRIVGNIGFVAAIAAAVPYYKALCIPLICGIKRSEPAETVTRDVSKGVSAPVEASAARFSAACKLGSACFAFAAAFAAATPESVAQLAFAQNGKSAEHTACQIVRCALPDTFVPQAATALRIPASERTFEHIPFRAAIAAAQILSLAPRGRHAPTQYSPAAKTLTASKPLICFPLCHCYEFTLSSPKNAPCLQSS